MLLEAARNGDEQAFRLLVEGECEALRSRCYRMLKSADDADDAVQETLLRAWRGLAGFRGQSSTRTWLHQIATNVCIDAIQRRRTRPQTFDYGPADEPTEATRWAPDGATAPEVECEQRETVELAFTAARQQLPTRQRAALILRDVLDFSAKEAASTLDTTVASVNSALQRARVAVDRRPLEPSRHALMRSASGPHTNNLGERFVNAFESGDVDTILELVLEA